VLLLAELLLLLLLQMSMEIRLATGCGSCGVSCCRLGCGGSFGFDARCGSQKRCNIV
jgi:hypothetical protein